MESEGQTRQSQIDGASGSGQVPSHRAAGTREATTEFKIQTDHSDFLIISLRNELSTNASICSEDTECDHF